MTEAKNQSAQGRLLSLDALRGLDMLFLVGITGVLENIYYRNALKVYPGLAERMQGLGYRLPAR